MPPEVTTKRRFDVRDFNLIAEQVCDEWSRRKKARSPLERQWKEIDRQLRMEPDVAHKLRIDGTVDPKKAWMPEMELPLQAQTLEMLTSDASRMKWPDSGSYFSAHAALTDKYLERVDFSAIIEGDENDVPSAITQDNADKLVQGAVNHWHRQYDMRSHYDQIDAEAFKYGNGVGRLRVAKKRVFSKTAKGVVRQEQEIPVLVPCSIWHTYLDDSPNAMMLEGHVIAPAEIMEKTQSISDLQIAANKGSTDPEDMQGGWMPAAVKRLEGDKHGNVRLLEYEGDIVVPRKTTSSVYIPNVIVTVAIGKKGDSVTQAVVRFRFNAFEMPSFINFPYHIEDLSTPYATSPLMKGMPIQKGAADALNRLLMSAALNVQPPMGYDQSDLTFAQNGGPLIFPGAQWGSVGDVQTYAIGDPNAMFAVYAGLLAQYADVTGVNAPRLGAQTVSHTTAFAKDAEISRGVVRTVDFVRASLHGPMAVHLSREYEIGRKNFKESTIYIDEYGGFVKIDKDHLPETVVFKVHGSGGPAENSAKSQARIQSAMMALQVDAAAVQQGRAPTIDHARLVEQLLREGGWTDVDAIIGAGEVSPGLAEGSPLGIGPGLPGVLSSTIA